MDKKTVLSRITKFEKAVRAHEMMGAMHPFDREEIEKNYLKAKASLREGVLALRDQP